MSEPIYLDFAATTPVDDRVLQAMLPFFSDNFGNPSSVHRWGQRAERALEQARRDVAEVLNCEPAELIFTSGGSEADNLALRGTALAVREATGANQLVTTPIEHDAVLSTMRQLRDHFGFSLALLPKRWSTSSDPRLQLRPVRWFLKTWNCSPLDCRILA